MKKLLIVLAFAGMSTAAMAQDTDALPSEKYSVATNSFWHNWFVQVGAEWNAFYSNEEKHAGYAKSPFKDFRGGLGFSVAVGKWFTPGIGLRTKLQGWNGFSVISENKDHNKVKFWNAQEQVLFNLSNLLCGYNPDRVWNLVPYAGVGIARNCSYNTYELGMSAGLLNTFKISQRVLFHVDLGFNMMGDDFEGRLGHKYYVDLGGKGGTPSPSNHDRWFTGEIGLTFNVGRVGWNKVPDVEALKNLHQSQLDALNAQLRDANNEIADLKNQLANIPEPDNTMSESVKEFVTTPISVFFNLDKTEIASQKDLVNVRALAKYAIENNNNLLVNGYADSATGTADHNQWLSERRAEQVADELVKMGVDRAKISTQGNGGVETLSPVSFNRRATVQITE